MDGPLGLIYVGLGSFFRVKSKRAAGLQQCCSKKKKTGLQERTVLGWRLNKQHEPFQCCQKMSHLNKCSKLQINQPYKIVFLSNRFFFFALIVKRVSSTLMNL
jgi:hypothetical protein